MKKTCILFALMALSCIALNNVVLVAEEEVNPFSDTKISVSESKADDEVASTASSVKAEEDKKEDKASTASSTSNVTTYDPPIEGTVVVGTSLNVRTGAWGNVIGSLYDDNKISIVAKEGDWYKFSYNGSYSYCHCNYVDTEFLKAGSTPVNYPWSGSSSGSSSSSNTPITYGTAEDDSGWGSAAPCVPMPNRISSEFGYRTHPVTGKKGTFHSGVDIPICTGSRVNALANGTVIAVGYENGGGNYVKVRYDNGLESFACHLKNATVKVGQRVEAGQQVAVSDNTGAYTTGAHLHLAIKKNGEYINPRSVIKLP